MKTRLGGPPTAKLGLCRTTLCSIAIHVTSCCAWARGLTTIFSAYQCTYIIICWYRGGGGGGGVRDQSVHPLSDHL